MTVQAAKDIELACDDDVAWELDREARARYGRTILAALPRKRRLEPVFSTHFGSTKKNMKGRLRNLFDMAAKRRGIAALCTVAVCAATVSGLVTVGASAATKSGDLPEIGAGHTFTVPAIKAGEVVCIGRLALEPDEACTVEVSVEKGSGAMIGLAGPGLTREDKAGWYFNNTIDLGLKLSGEWADGFCLYVGSRAGEGTDLTGVTGNITTQGQEAALGGKPLAGWGISAKAADSTWASATGVEGASYRAQLDSIISWLDKIDRENKSAFVISETVPEGEALSTAGTRYLYDNSAAFRTMSAMKDGAFQVQDSESFSRFALPAGKVYDRTAVMVDTSQALTLDCAYTLATGKMSVWLIDPSGNTAYKSDAAAAFSDQIPVAGAKGLWSVIMVSEPVNGAVSGSCRIVLRTGGTAAPQSPAAETSPAGQTFKVERLGQHTFAGGDKLSANLTWSGSGDVMLLYTDRTYSDDELLVPIQGMPGVPKPDYSKVDQSKIGSIFNFSKTKTSPLAWEVPDVKPGTYWFYLVRLEDPGRIAGNVSRTNAAGGTDSIWTQT